jgi:hypothetical protein
MKKQTETPLLPKSTRRQVRLLARLRNQFGAEAREWKLALLKALSGAEIIDSGLLLEYHEALLFIRVYPDDRAVFSIARKECDRFGRRVRHLGEVDPDAVEQLAEEAIPETSVSYQYDYTTVTELVKWFGDALEIQWEEYEDTEKLDSLLPLLASWGESDGLDLAPVSTAEWVDLARGGSGLTGLRWLLAGIDRLKAPYLVQRQLYDALELPVVWQLGNSPACRTHARVASGEPYFHQGPLLRKMENFHREVKRPLERIHHASPAAARHLIKTIRCALAVRHRGLYPVEYASPDEVIVARCNRGYQLVLFGMKPGFRLPIESDYAALIIKNGYVIGYGVGALLFDQCEIAINIFDTWRGGEAAYIFSQYLRVFHQHFGCTRFRMERYQVGYENDEGLQSGSYWFYRKLGFVSEAPDVRALCEREMKKIKRTPGYRTPIATLKKLAVSDMYYTLKGDPEKLGSIFPLTGLSLNTTRLIGERFGGDRKKALAQTATALSAALNCRGRERWPAMERLWFERLAPTISLIPGLGKWSAADKKGLLALLRAKGHPRESGFVRLLAENRRLRRALEKAAGS